MKELIFKNQKGEEIQIRKYMKCEEPIIRIGSNYDDPINHQKCILAPGIYTIEVTDPDDPQPQDWAKENSYSFALTPKEVRARLTACEAILAGADIFGAHKSAAIAAKVYKQILGIPFDKIELGGDNG